MSSTNITLLVLIVIVAGAATIAMAVAFAGTGAPVWMAAMGPVLLVAAVVVHLRGRQKR